MPNLAHIIYIPGILMLGLVLGFIWGAKATREAAAIEQQREGERAQRKAAREARKAAAAEAGALDTKSDQT